MKQCTDKGTQRVQARYGAELPPFISIVQYSGRPVILGMEIGVPQMDKILRFFPRPEIGQFSPHIGAISLLNYTENLEEKKSTGEN